MYTWAGPEIAVATTKAYSAQLISLYLLAMKFAHVRGELSDKGLADMIEELKELPTQVEMLLNNQKQNTEVCKPLPCSQEHFLYRKRNRLCNFPGRVSEAEGGFLYSFRSVCGRRTEARNHFSDRRRYSGMFCPYTGRVVQKDDQQYGRSKDKRSICDGGHKLWTIRKWKRQQIM